MSDDNGSFLGGLAESGNPAAPAAGAPPAGIGLGEAAPVSPASPQAPAGVARPEWIKEKFWDPDKGEVRTQDLANSYNQIEKYIGGDKIPVPKDPDDKMAWELYWKAGGVPDTADAYQFARPDDLPKDLPYDDEAEKSYRSWAHQNHLNPDQAKNLYDAYVKTQIERHVVWEADRKQQRERLNADFNREYGRSADGVRQSVGALMQKYADPDFHQFLSETGTGNDPRMLRVFAKISKDMGGTAKLQGTPSAAGAPRSASELQAAITEYRAAHNKALMNPDAPDHAHRRDHLFKLHEELVAARGTNVL